MQKSLTGLVVALVSLFLSAPILAAGADNPADYMEQMKQWRQKRHDRLADPDGWMTLVGMEWLETGENKVGAAESSDARIPGGPDHWGVIYLEGDSIRFLPADGSGVTVDGETVEEVTLVADSQGKPTVVRSDDLSFYVIQRGSYALRIKDRKASALLAFEEMPAYEISPGWRIEGRFVRADEGATLEIANVLGQINESPVFGTFEFEREGDSFSLVALGTEESSSLWFLFADKTTGRETYGAGRYLYSDGMPEDGKLVVDFNKAYNPPCAYNNYSTCALPPQQNRMKIAVQAGEKKYHD
jgi:uncharacterized protein (DUF1684 family)